MMKKLCVLTLVAVIAVTAQAVLVDDFSDTDLSEYTVNYMLTQNETNTTSYSSTSGVLQVSKTDSAWEAEQVVMVRDDYSLGIGEILRVDTAGADDDNYADFGICVAIAEDLTDVTPGSSTVDGRYGYLAIYGKHLYDAVGWAGFDGDGTALASSSGATITWADITGLYIVRNSATEFAAGYTTADGDIELVVWTVTDTTMGTAVGFYSDVRSATTYGDLDNLTIVPEPATMLLLGLGSLLGFRKRKSRL